MSAPYNGHDSSESDSNQNLGRISIHEPSSPQSQEHQFNQYAPHTSEPYLQPYSNDSSPTAHLSHVNPEISNLALSMVNQSSGIEMQPMGIQEDSSQYFSPYEASGQYGSSPDAGYFSPSVGNGPFPPPGPNPYAADQVDPYQATPVDQSYVQSGHVEQGYVNEVPHDGYYELPVQPVENAGVYAPNENLIAVPNSEYNDHLYGTGEQVYADPNNYYNNTGLDPNQVQVQPVPAFEPWSYDTVAKSAQIPASTHFKIRRMFKEMDPECTTFVDVQTLVAQVTYRLHDTMADFRFNKLMNELNTYELEYPGQPMEFTYFYQMITHVISEQVMGAKPLNHDGLVSVNGNTTYTINNTLNDAAIHAKHVEDVKLSRMNPCSRCWFRCGKSFKKKVIDNDIVLPCFRGLFNKVQSRFGSTVVTYFYFAQSLLFLNLLLILLMAIVFIPGMFYFNWHTPDVTVTRLVNGVPTEKVITQSLSGLLFGSGMEFSFMFYGDMYTPYFDFASGYRVDLAWVFVCIAVLVVSVLDNISRFSLGQEELGDRRMKFARLAFANFDHSMRTKESTKLQSQRFLTTFYAYLNEVKEDQIIADNKDGVVTNYYALKLRRLFGFIINLGFLVGIAFLVTWLIIREDDIRDSVDTSLGLAAEFLVPFCVSFIKFIIPKLVTIIVTLEGHETYKTTMQHITFRVFIMKMFFVLLILFQTQSFDADTSLVCPQTATGIFYYRMMVMDFLMEIVSSLGLPFFTFIMKRYVCKCVFKLQVPQLKADPSLEERYEHQYLTTILSQNPADFLKPEFGVPPNLIDLMYRQALVWAAVPYSPVMPVLGFIFIVLMMFVKSIQINYLTRMPMRPMAIASQNNLFRTYLLATLGLMCIPFSFWLRGRVDCGPNFFLDCKNGVCKRSNPIDTIVRWVATLPRAARVILNFIQAPALLWVCLLLVIIYAVYILKKYRGGNDEVDILRDWLSLEKSEMDVLRQEYQASLDMNEDLERADFNNFIAKMKANVRPVVEENLVRRHFTQVTELARLSDEEKVMLVKEWWPHLDDDAPEVLSFVNHCNALQAQIKI